MRLSAQIDCLHLIVLLTRMETLQLSYTSKQSIKCFNINYSFKLLN